MVNGIKNAKKERSMKFVCNKLKKKYQVDDVRGNHSTDARAEVSDSQG